jgi:hypothetical protein
MEDTSSHLNIPAIQKTRYEWFIIRELRSEGLKTVLLPIGSEKKRRSEISYYVYRGTAVFPLSQYKPTIHSDSCGEIGIQLKTEKCLQEAQTLISSAMTGYHRQWVSDRCPSFCTLTTTEHTDTETDCVSAFWWREGDTSSVSSFERVNRNHLTIPLWGLTQIQFENYSILVFIRISSYNIA